MGMIDVAWTEVTHVRGVILGSALPWIFVGMFNLLRLRNGGSVEGLTIFCIGANLAESVPEVVSNEPFAKAYRHHHGANGLCFAMI
jgi:hypothetical protein